MNEVQKELDSVYITSDGKKFLLKHEAEKHERNLEKNDYKILDR